MKKKNLLKIISLTLPVIIIIAFLLLRDNQPTKTTENQSQPINELDTNSSNIFYLNSNLKKIEWLSDEIKKEEIPAKYITTNINMSNLADDIAVKLNFDPKTYIDINMGDKMWTRGDQVLLFLNKDKVIEISYPTKKTFKSGFIEKQLVEESLKIVSNLVNTSNLTIKRIEYFLLDNYESMSGKMENSRIAKVHFSQTTPDSKKIIIPENFSDFSTISLTIDSSLQPRYLKINNLLDQITPSTEKKTVTFNKDSIKTNLLHRVTPYDIDHEIELEQSQNATIKANKINTVYTQSNSTLYPIYLIEGNIYIEDEDIGPASLVAPIVNFESL